MGEGGISRCRVDYAGGLLVDRGRRFVRIEGAPIAFQGDLVTGHGKHKLNAMIEGVQWFRIEGTPVCRTGHRASCGCTAGGAAWFRLRE